MSPLGYVERADRCFYVSGTINDEMVKALLPEINRLRLQSNEPITTYIDSPGGSIHAADTIRSLATAPDADGIRRELITVCIGTSASAAADMLALGDHAIAYEHSVIVYHGTRQNQRNPLTFEDAELLASHLRQTNELFAMRLARRILKRILYPISQLKSFEDYKNKEDASLSVVVEDLCLRLSAQAQMLVKQSKARCEAITKLTDNILKVIKMRKPRKNSKTNESLELQHAVLNAIIKYKSNAHKKEAWSLRDGGLEEVLGDYNMFDDFHFGYHNIHRTNFARTSGQLLLSSTQLEQYQEIQFKNDEEKRKWLMAACDSKIQELWYFCVSIGRALQTDDYFLSPFDAFWLGLIDEVPGSGIKPLRSIAKDLQTHLSSSIVI